jgi:anti-sigma factor RsiW
MFTPEPGKPWPPAPCAEYEEKILELQDHQLTEPARRSVEAHLAACPACRRFAEELQSLDTALAAKFEGKMLPPSFKPALLSRIDAAAAAATPDVIARRKEAIESEFQKQSAGLLRRVVRENWWKLLDGVGLVTMAIVLALLVQLMVSGSLSVSAFLPKSLADQGGTYLLWATAAAAVTGALWFGSRYGIREFGDVHRKKLMVELSRERCR